MDLLPLIRVVFSDAELVSSSPFPGEHANLCYQVQMVNPTLDVIIKIYRRTEQRRPWKEAYLLRLLTSETGVPVPRPLHLDDSLTLVPQPWMLQTRLPGEPLSEVIHSLDQWELESVAYEMGRYMAHLHQIKLDFFGDFYTPELGITLHEQEAVLSWIDELVNAGLAQKTLPTALAQSIRQVLQAGHLFNAPRACLIHDHYTPQNIMVERGLTDYHMIGVLDWTEALGGSPERDMSRVFNWPWPHPQNVQKGFLDGYTESAEIDAQFWRRLRIYQIADHLEHLGQSDGTANPARLDAIERLLADLRH